MVQMEIVTDPVEIARAERQDEKFRANWEWFKENCAAIYRQHRGKCLCIAGKELFVGESAEQVLAHATAAHPDDDGRFMYYVRRHRVPRVYGTLRAV